MRILHVIPTFAPAWRYGGPVRAAFEMTRALARRGHQVRVLTTDVDGPGRLDVPLDKDVAMEGVSVRYHALSFPRWYIYSSSLRKSLLSEVPKHDVVHIHSLFYYPTTAAAHYSRRAGVPYVMRPAGSLDPICFSKTYEEASVSWRSRAKKAVYWRVIGRREIAEAAAVHFTSEEERMAAAPMIGASTAAVIPLGVEPPPNWSEPPARLRETVKWVGERPIILFMSRLDPKKGLDILIKACSLLARQAHEFRLLVAGDGDPGYEAKIDALIAQLGLSDKARRLGRVDADERWTLLRKAAILALPSHHENFGIAVVEGLAAGIPVVVSNRVNIAKDIEADHAGLVAELSPESVAARLRTLIGDPALRAEMGRAAAACYRRRYTWDIAVERLETLYSSIIHGRHEDHPPA